MRVHSSRPIHPACRPHFSIVAPLAVAIWCLGAPAVLRAAEPAPLEAAAARAVEFLRVSQSADGSWTTDQSPGITGLVTAAVLQNGVKPEDPMVQKAFAFIGKFAQEDGGIYANKTGHGNYETCIALLAYKAANRDGRHDQLIARAGDFLKKLQWSEEHGIKSDDIKFGGAGYGRSQDRPDLSNTAFLLDALKAAGVGSDDPAFKNALVFVSRCQNLESASNLTPFASKINDGGFYYTPAAGGSSPAGKEENEGLRSYGSMTYAGLKSMIYAGLKADDPRVKAASDWLRKHYTLDENPGMGQGGLYYYYHSFAKALAALKSPTFADAKGVDHNWRAELQQHLLSRQKENGSWVNSESRWMEGDPNLTTAYALLTLVYCRPAAK